MVGGKFTQIAEETIAETFGNGDMDAVYGDIHYVKDGALADLHRADQDAVHQEGLRDDAHWRGLDGRHREQGDDHEGSPEGFQEEWDQE